jgi:hypothetical protein
MKPATTTTLLAAIIALVTAPPLTHAAAPTPATPAAATASADAKALPEIKELPDPFKFQDGTMVKSKADWPKRREELSQLIQKYQYGPYPAKPDKVTGTLNGNTLNVKVDYKGKSINYNVTITRPQGDGPFPAMVLISSMMPGINAQNLSPRGVATIVFQPTEIAADAKNPLRAGKLYTLYGTDCKTSALMGWGWGIHRVIDALESTPDAKIDPKHIGVAGYSRYGKGALVAGAFDERIALTIPGGSGAGGVGSWRAADPISGVQTLKQINGEAPQWFTEEFPSFIGRTNTLPFDAHEIIALVAPRAIIIQEGTTDSWNNNANAGPFQSAWAARKVFDYLDISDRLGWVTDPHGHGQMTARESAAVMAFVDRFLLEKKDVATKFFDDNPKVPTISWKAPETK